ncbi:MAG TPA: LLM class F420-dependent oxidoreductase [Acidimicrobiales bacterium]|jgi:probable F420-dependent oxidoreductase|nr:LLM class F420-dependent oxidoreductase [Acidimicrobiales bacterium]
MARGSASVTTRIGIFADLTDQTMGPVEFAEAVETRGFSALFLNEHTHLPVDCPTSQFPPGGEIPERYARFWDPYIALSFVAASTQLTIGTGVSLIGEHDPIQLAHAIATLDALSDGRLVVGVGWGWNREEFADHGRSPEVRAQVVKEWVLVMRELWTNEIAAFDGRFVTLAPSRCWPKPVQKPGPPILLGAPASERNFARVAQWADGWITMGEEATPEQMTDALAKLRKAWDEAGRGLPGPRVTLIHNPVAGAPPFDEVIELAGEVGVERVLYHVFDGDRDRMLRRLDRAAEVKRNPI